MKSALGVIRCGILLLIAGSLSMAVPVRAQRGGEVAKATATLPAETQTVLHRLEALRELPDGAWFMHAGDLAHGEAAELDTSSWQKVSNGFKAPNEAVWFRQTYTVPAGLRPDRRAYLV